MQPQPRAGQELPGLPVRQGEERLLASAEIERHVKDMEESFNAFITQTSEVVITFEPTGYIKSANIAIDGVLGYKRTELVGKDIRSIYRNPDILDRDVLHIRNGGEVSNTYVDLIKWDTSSLPATQSIRLLKNANGTADYVVFIKELETKRALKEKEKGIKELSIDNASLKRESDLKAEFINNIAHELKTPLTNIIGFSKLLHDGEVGTMNPDQNEYLNTILDEANRLLIIIKQVLDASRLNAEKVKLEPRDVNLKEMRQNPGIRALEEDAKNKGLQFSWNVDFDVPDIFADPNRLVQAFVNLIGNAIKFTEHGSISIKIKRSGKKKVECTVSDTGMGISDEAKSKIFKKFYQAPRKDLKQQVGAGTGLGLAITKDIIKLHGGKISLVESQSGVGTTFRFILPIRPRQKREKQQVPVSPAS
jgi:PAS domain S-box-containing protein